MNNAKDIAENIVESHYKHGPNFTLDLEDAEKLAHAYLELNEKYDKVLSYTSESLDIDTAFTIVSMKDENTKLKKSRDVLRKAVGFYGNWVNSPDGILHRSDCETFFVHKPLEKDKNGIIVAGKKAREALKADNEIFADDIK